MQTPDAGPLRPDLLKVILCLCRSTVLVSHAIQSIHLHRMSEKGLVDYIRNNSPTLEPKETGVEALPHRFPKVKLCLFDIYGTLFISGSGDVGTAKKTSTAGAFQFALTRSLGAYVDSACALQASELFYSLIRDQHQRAQQNGILQPEVDIRDIWRSLLLQLAGDCLTDDLADVASAGSEELVEYISVCYECRVNPTHPMPGLASTLHDLARRNVKLGLVSNAQFFTPLLFQAHLGERTAQLGFDHRFVSYSYLAGCAKPDPSIFEPVLQAAREEEIAANEILYIGNDMRNDIQTAHQLGLRTALFAGDQRSLRMRRDSAPDIKPDAILTHLSELPELLQGEPL